MSLLLMLGLSGRAQERNNAAVAVDALRVQLIEVQEKEGSLRLRAQQLEEELKPENIEHVFAGIGSTRPEELREARRRQLTIERDSVKAQLKLVELTKERLETAVAAAEGRAYQVNALRADSMLFTAAFVAILVLSFMASLGTVIFAVRGLNR
jgi:hypothetical protein